MGPLDATTGIRMADISIGACENAPGDAGNCTDPRRCVFAWMNSITLQGDAIGGDRRYCNGTDPKVCQALCKANSECKAWTYDAGLGDCSLKGGILCPGTKVTLAYK